MLTLAISALLLASLSTTQGVEFHNKVAAAPVVHCAQDSIGIEVETTVPGEPPSRIFAKGQSSKEACTFLSTNSANFSLSNCNMERQRNLAPRGLYYSITVVVQMHPLFITKVDRAYNIKCFYMEAEKTLTAAFDVSMIATQTLDQGSEMPQCRYGIHRDTPTGPQVRYAEIGDKVHHVWECPSDSYGLLVHSCFVDDGQNNRIQILDENGCGMDQYVMKTPNYSTDLTSAQQETHVFKFADRLAVKFQCQIKLCMKNEGTCDEITPPKCPDTTVGDVTERLTNLGTATSVAQQIDKSTQSHSPSAEADQTLTPDLASITPETPESTSPDSLVPQDVNTPPNPFISQAPTTQAELTSQSPAAETTSQETKTTFASTTDATTELLGSTENDTTIESQNSTVTTEGPTPPFPPTIPTPQPTPGTPGPPSETPTDNPSSEGLIDVSSTPATSSQSDAVADSLEGSGEHEQPVKNGGALEVPFPTPYGFPDTSGTSGTIVRRALISTSRDDPIRALAQEDGTRFNSKLEMDIGSEMFVLEPDEAQRLPDALRNYDYPEQVARSAEEEKGKTTAEVASNTVCLSTAGLSVSIAAFVLMSLTCIVAFCVLCQRIRARKTLPSRTGRSSAFWDGVPNGPYKL